MRPSIDVAGKTKGRAAKPESIPASQPAPRRQLRITHLLTTRWRWAGIAVLAVLLLVPLRVGNFGEFVFAIAFIYVLVALGLHVLVQWGGQISFGHIAFVGLGAHVTATFASAGRPVWFAMSAGILCCLIVGFIVGIPALRIRGFYLAILTFAFGYAADRWLFRQTWLTGTILVGRALPRPKLFGTVFADAHMYLLILVSLVLVIAGLSRMRRTKAGRALMAVRHSEDLAASFGINVAANKVAAFMISSSIAGLGGSLWAYTLGTVDQTTFPVALSMVFITLVVIGGPGPLWGTAVFAFAFGLLPPLIGGQVAEWMHLVGPIGLLFVLLQYPGGQNQAIADVGRMAKLLSQKLKREQSTSAGTPGASAAREAAGSDARPAGSSSESAASNGRAAALEINGISVRFGGLQALQQVNLIAREGVVTGLIGPNGAGKSTLLNCISGLLAPQSGEVRVFGQEITSTPAHARAQAGIGRTFQYMALCPDESVRQNLLIAQHRTAGYNGIEGVLGGRLVRSVERGLVARADEMLNLFDLSHLANRPARDLSLGTAKRLELACVLACNPSVLLLDEPTGGLDQNETQRLVRVLEAVRDERRLTTLLVSHNMRLVMGMAAEMYVLNFGQVLAHGTPSHIRRNAKVIDAYLGAVVDGK